MLNSLRDVASYLGVDVRETDSEDDLNASLSRRVYKSTACGAWAKIVTRPVVRTEDQTWSARYAKIDGSWTLVTLARDGAPRSTWPDEVQSYFWPPDIAEYLDGIAEGRSDLTLADTVRIRTVHGTELVFRVGSIVEGSDAEVWPAEVVLPAAGSDIDAAIQHVEDEADRIWNEANE